MKFYERDIVEFQVTTEELRMLHLEVVESLLTTYDGRILSKFYFKILGGNRYSCLVVFCDVSPKIVDKGV